MKKANEKRTSADRERSESWRQKEVEYFSNGKLPRRTSSYLILHLIIVLGPNLNSGLHNLLASPSRIKMNSLSRRQVMLQNSTAN